MKIGIVGGGQLGQMMALAGYPLGFEFQFVDRTTDIPAARIAPVLSGDLQDVALLRALADTSPGHAGIAWAAIETMRKEIAENTRIHMGSADPRVAQTADHFDAAARLFACYCRTSS